MRRLVAPLTVMSLVLALSGCLFSGVKVQRLGSKSYNLSMPYSTVADLKHAETSLHKQAHSLCPMGWYKSNDYDRLDDGEHVLVWVIACNEQYRPSEPMGSATR